MKFALVCLLCALVPLGPGCTSSAPKGSSSARSASASDSKAATDADDDTAASKPPKGPAYLLRMVDYRSGARFELVNPSHTTALDQYSKVRKDWSRKVTSEEWMTGLIKFMKEQGWSKEEQRGSAPTMAKGVMRWSLEMVSPAGTSFIAEPMDAKGSQRTRLRTMQKAFLDTYNETVGYQAAPGELVPFKPGAYLKDRPEHPPKKGGK